MIFKKPYAFLVKYFKLIHLVLFLLIMYIAFKYINILTFFNSYIASGYKTNITAGLADIYTPIFLFAITFLVLLLSGAILYLLVYKKKPIKFYIIIVIYYLILFAFFIYLRGIYNNLVYNLISATLSRSLRDIILMFFIPQIAFIVFSFIRMVGFDIKKFDFKSDIKELGISSKDAEEFEVTLSFDNYKTKRKINKTLREFKYYIFENKFVVFCVAGFLGLIFIYLIINSFHLNYDKNYSENQSFVYENIRYKVTNTFISNLDYKGQVIKNDKYYLIINFNVSNDSGDALNINYDDFKLKINDAYYNPNINYIGNFIDIAYKDSAFAISPSSSKNISLIYEVEASVVRNNMQLAINNGIVIDKKESINKHIYVKLKPEIIEKKDTKEYNLNDMVSFADSYLKNSSIIIKNVSFSKNYIYDYEICKKECKKYNDMVSVSLTNNRQNNVLMALDSSLIIDNDSVYYYNYQEKSSFVENFIRVKTDDIVSSYNVTPKNLDNVILLEVPSNIVESDKIYLVINIRNKEYIIKVK